MNNPNLTPRQLEAQAVYNRKSKRFLWPLRLLYFIGWGALVFYLYHTKTRFETSGQSPLGNVMLTGIFVAIAVAVGAIWAHKRAFDAVRDAGLLDEEHETIRRTATTFAGATLAFGYSNNRWSDVGLLLVLVGVAALMGWFALCFATQTGERILAALGFAFFVGYALLTVATSNQPAVSLDERGVFAYYRNFWPRLVRWHEIESAHFYRQTNFHGGADICTITLKNAADETLLTLNAATFLDAPPGFEARFVAELRRRLMGESAT